MVIPMAISPQFASNLQLYTTDYYRWLAITIQQLRDGNVADLDVDNLLEELEDIGRSEKRAVYSNLKILLLHLLKYRYQPDMRSNSWLGSIVEHRQRLNRAFKESPSLKPYYTEMFAEVYGEARELAAAETGMDIEVFSAVSLFSPEEVLRSNYLPEA